MSDDALERELFQFIGFGVGAEGEEDPQAVVPSTARVKRSGSRLSAEIAQWGTQEFADIMDDDFEFPLTLMRANLLSLCLSRQTGPSRRWKPTNQWVDKPSAATRCGLLIL